MQEVKSITLVLENCESITISKEHIGLFYCKNITATIARVACNSISKDQCCEEFCLEIRKNADRHYDSFGFEDDETVFTRLARPDITGINIKYEDDATEYCFVPWKSSERSRCYNEYQTSRISKNGNMYIGISRDRSIEDMVEFDSID